VFASQRRPSLITFASSVQQRMRLRSRSRCSASTRVMFHPDEYAVRPCCRLPVKRAGRPRPSGRTACAARTSGAPRAQAGASRGSGVGQVGVQG
jgi:hypothetical protein